MREWPKTPRERRLWIDQGWYKAAAERYRVSMIALGNLPPTPGEIEKIMANGPPEWWVAPKEYPAKYRVFQLGFRKCGGRV